MRQRQKSKIMAMTTPPPLVSTSPWPSTSQKPCRKDLLVPSCLHWCTFSQRFCGDRYNKPQNLGAWSSNTCFINCNWNGSNVEVITYRIQSIDPHYKATKESNVNVYDSITQVTMLHQPNLFYIQMFSEVNNPQDIQLWMD